MEKLVAKRCPECDGEPQFVHFYVAKEDGGLLRKYGTEKVHYVEPSDKIIKLGRIN